MTIEVTALGELEESYIGGTAFPSYVKISETALSTKPFKLYILFMYCRASSNRGGVNDIVGLFPTEDAARKHAEHLHLSGKGVYTDGYARYEVGVIVDDKVKFVIEGQGGYDENHWCWPIKWVKE